MMIDTESVFHYLNDNRFGPDDIPYRPEPGVYAIFAAQPECLPLIVLPPSALVYIGRDPITSPSAATSVKRTAVSVLQDGAWARFSSQRYA